MLITVFKGMSIGLAIQTNALFLLPQMLITYSFLYYVLPHLWLGKIKKFLFSLAIFLVGSLFFTYAFRYFVLIPFRTGHFQISPNFHQVFTANNYFLCLTITGFASVIKFFSHWYQKEQVNQQLMQENATAELQLLKSQIHPHFLFNTLNNLYASTLKQSNKATEVVDKLSNLLKYMLYECNSSDIKLEREIEMLNNYIELEKLRYGKRLNIICKVKGEVKNMKIAPLLMLPFLENAFKHGSAEVIGTAQIIINIEVENNDLTFFIFNNFMNSKKFNDNSFSGIGLKNVEKRLNLLYGSKYSLLITSDIDIFSVEMKVPLASSETTHQSKMVEIQ